MAVGGASEQQDGEVGDVDSGGGGAQRFRRGIGRMAFEEEG